MARKSNLSSKRAVDAADRLHSAAIRLLRLVRAQDAITNIGPAQLSALSVLVFGGAMSLKRLAAAEQVRPPTMSRIVAALEKQRLVQREILRNDRREIRLHVTAKGSSLMYEARKRRVSALAERVSQLKPSELDQLDAA